MARYGISIKESIFSRGVRRRDNVVVVWRIDKEKNLMKTEIDDLKGQIDHLSKGKVGDYVYVYGLLVTGCLADIICS